MNRSNRSAFAAAVGVLAGFAVCAVPSASAQTVDTVRIASALEWPLYVTSAPGEPYHIYIVLKRGTILRHDIRTNTSTPFINLDSVVINPTGVGDERGLLGLAFDPAFQTNGRFYVNYYSNSNTTVVARYTASGGIGSPGSGVTLLSFSQPFTNHNGGWMGFSPRDGFLYIASGDGGSGNDPLNSGQTLTTLLGKILRIDVNGNNGSTGNYGNPPTNPFVGIGGEDEIWAWGLRNSWRCSFDRDNGAFYIGDVGQNAIEEINFQANNSVGGENYGWRCLEGNSVTGLCGVVPPGTIPPFHTYGHGIGISVTGGYVYRGCAIPSLAGHYFYADYGTARIWTRSGASATAAPIGAEVDRTADLSPPIGGGSIVNMASFGEDFFGEIYLMRHSTASGEIFRIIPQGGITDCNGNNIADCNERRTGLESDCDGNLVLDSCQITSNPALDCDANTQLDSCQIAANPALDCDANAQLDSCQIAANPALDCDSNAQIDSCQIAANPALDCNSDGRLDACQLCFGDADLDLDRDFGDITSVLNNFGVNYGLCLVGAGDANHDGQVSFADATAILTVFSLPCP